MLWNDFATWLNAKKKQDISLIMQRTPVDHHVRRYYFDVFPLAGQILTFCAKKVKGDSSKNLHVASFPSKGLPMTMEYYQMGGGDFLENIPCNCNFLSSGQNTWWIFFSLLEERSSSFSFGMDWKSSDGTCVILFPRSSNLSKFGKGSCWKFIPLAA